MDQIFFRNVMRQLVQYFKPFRIFKDDIFIVSFPRSGNTWLRFFLANLRKKEFRINEVDYVNIEFLCPDIHSYKFGHYAARPRFFKSHFRCLRRYPKVIYLLRDPRDTSLSFFGMLIKRGFGNQWKDFNQFWPDFLGGRVPYGSWCNHILSYENYKGYKLLVKYEEMLRDPIKAVLPIIEFISLHTTDKEINEALNASSPERLKLLSKRVAFIKDWEIYDKKKLARIEKTKAVSGKWFDILSHKQNDQIFEIWGNVMQRYGYYHKPV